MHSKENEVYYLPNQGFWLFVAMKLFQVVGSLLAKMAGLGWTSVQCSLGVAGHMLTYFFPCVLKRAYLKQISSRAPQPGESVEGLYMKAHVVQWFPRMVLCKWPYIFTLCVRDPCVTLAIPSYSMVARKVLIKNGFRGLWGCDTPLQIGWLAAISTART